MRGITQLTAAYLLLSSVALAFTPKMTEKVVRRTNESHSLTDSFHHKFSLNSGAEDHNLSEIRNVNMRNFHTFLNVLGVSPHVAIGALKLSSSDYLDNVIFGKDEAEKKSPWNWTLFWLAPGSMACIYMSYFMDSNFFLSLALMTCFISLDLLFWSDLIGIIIPKTRGHALITILVRPINAIVTAILYHYIVFPLSWTFWVTGMYYLWLLILPFVSILYVFYRVTGLYRSFCAHYLEIRDIEIGAFSVINRALNENNLGFVSESWKEMYEPPHGGFHYEVLGDGAFGSVVKGRLKGSTDPNDLVAIKTIKTVAKNNESVLGAAILLAGTAVLGNAASVAEDVTNTLKSSLEQ